MAISVKQNSFVAGGGQQISLASMFAVTTDSSNPAYLVLTGLDRNEYTVDASTATGTLKGNGITDAFSGIGGDGRGAGAVFTYQPSTGRYFSRAYGYFDQMTYTVSSSTHDLVNFSLFTTNNLSLATSHGNDAYAMEQFDASGYIGSVTIATQANFGTMPTQATPNSICSVAQSFVGQTWNINGCWVLASTIAANAGASLPVDSSMVGVSGQPNGEWFCAFDGTRQSGNWQSMVTAGEMIVIGNASSGHITTCVSGSGSSALLIDNVAYVNSSGAVLNLANDGSSSDLMIASAHLASQEWTGMLTSMVKIYELDCPVVSALAASDTLKINTSQLLSSLFSAADPAGKAVTQYQVYDTSAIDSLIVNGVAKSAHSASAAVAVDALSSISLSAADTGSDIIEVRAYNGSFWGDWQTLNVAVTSALSPPTVANQTVSQIWKPGQTISLALPADTFLDSNGQSLTYGATLSNGQALPAWLKFNPVTDTFSGTVPTDAKNLSIKVTATDTSMLSVSETFSVAVPAAAPVVAHRTPHQSWLDGQKVSLTIPANTFSDPQGQTLSFKAFQVGGTPVTSWLHFNPATGIFFGTVPLTASGTAILEVVATDAHGLIATDIFNVSFSPATSVHHIELIGVMAATSMNMAEFLPLH